MPRKSSFKGILGTDFLRKESIVVDFQSSKIKIKNYELSFKNFDKSSEKAGDNKVNSISGELPVNQVDLVDFENQNEDSEPCKIIEQNESVNSKQISSSQQNKENLKVRAVRKIILKPNEPTYIEAKSNNCENLAEFIYEPHFKNKQINAKSSIHAVKNDDVKNISSKISPTHKSSQQINFFIMAENTSNKPIHINKDQIIG